MNEPNNNCGRVTATEQLREEREREEKLSARDENTGGRL